MEETMTYPHQVFLLGDPINHELFYCGMDKGVWHTESTEMLPGGIALTRHLLLEKLPSHVRVHPLYETISDKWIRMQTYVNSSTGQKLLDGVHGTIGACRRHYNGPTIDHLEIYRGRKGLVVVDQDLGTCTTSLTQKQVELIHRERFFDFAIVDGLSAHTQIQPWLDASKVRVLHVNGREWAANRERFSHFTYVVATTGVDPVEVFRVEDTSVRLVERVSFPAGSSVASRDRLVAGLATHFATHALQAWDDEFMVAATRTAMDWSIKGA